jgi:hypothetical protein
MNTQTLFSVGTLSGDTKGGVKGLEFNGTPAQQ